MPKKNKVQSAEAPPPFDVEKDVVFGEEATSPRPAGSGCTLPVDVIDVLIKAP